MRATSRESGIDSSGCDPATVVDDSRPLKGRRSVVRSSYDGRSRSDYLWQPRLGPVSGLVRSRHGSPETASIPETIGEFS
jgi:hypothetical protein